MAGTSTDLTDKQIGEIETALWDGGPLPSGIVINYTMPLFYRRMTAAEVKAADALAARFARKPDSLGEGELSLTWRERVKTWLTLARASARRAKVAAVASAAAASVAGSASVWRNLD